MHIIEGRLSKPSYRPLLLPCCTPERPGMLILAWLLHQHCRELMCHHAACMPHCREELNPQTMDAGKEENGDMGFPHEAAVECTEQAGCKHSTIGSRSDAVFSCLCRCQSHPNLEAHEMMGAQLVEFIRATLPEFVTGTFPTTTSFASV